MLPGFDGSNLMALGFVRRQLPAQKPPFLLSFARVKPLAALGAPINALPVRNPVFLITPVVHSLFPGPGQNHRIVMTLYKLASVIPPTAVGRKARTSNFLYIGKGHDARKK